MFEIDITQLNWWAILVSTLVAFVLGGIWYGPLFGNLWLKELKTTKFEMEPSLTPFLVTLVTTFITCLNHGHDGERATNRNLVGGRFNRWGVWHRVHRLFKHFRWRILSLVLEIRRYSINLSSNLLCNHGYYSHDLVSQ